MSSIPPRTPPQRSRLKSDNSGSKTDSSTIISQFQFSKKSSPLPEGVREVVIKTEQPDVPYIKLIRVDQTKKMNLLKGIQRISATLQGRRVKNVYTGLLKLMDTRKNMQISSIHVKLLCFILESKRKSILSNAVRKLRRNLQQDNKKLLHSRLLGAILSSLYSRILKSTIFFLRKDTAAKIALQQHKQEQMKINITRHQRSKTQVQQKQVQHINFSTQFIQKCKIFSKLSIQHFLKRSLKQLEPITKKQVSYLQKQNINSNEYLIVLCLSNSLSSIAANKQQIEGYLQIIDEYKGNDSTVSDSKIIKEFQIIDQELEKQITGPQRNLQKCILIIQKNLSEIDRKKTVSEFQRSRSQLLRMLLMLMKEEGNGLTLHLQEVVKISGNYQKLKEYKQKKLPQIKIGSKETKLMQQIINKLLVLSDPAREIKEATLYENEDNFEQQINYISKEVIKFIDKFRVAQKKDKIELFEIKSPTKKSHEFEKIYDSFRSLAHLLKNTKGDSDSDIVSQQPDKPKPIQKIIRSKTLNKAPENQNFQNTAVYVQIMTKFISCLHEGSYQKWEKYISQPAFKSEQLKKYLQKFQQINDFLNEKIEEAGKQADPKKDFVKQEEECRKCIQFSKIQHQNSQLKKELQKIQKERKKQFSDRNTESIKLNEELSSKNKALTQSTRQVQQLKHQLKALQQKNEFSAQSGREIQQLKRQLKDFQENNKNLAQSKREIQQLKHQIKNEKNKYVSAEKMWKSTISENEMKMSKMTIESETNKLKQLEDNLRSNFEENQRQYRQEIQRLMSENMQIKDQNSKLRKQCVHLSRKIEKIEAKCREYQTEIDSSLRLKQKLQVREMEYKQLLNQVTRCKQSIEYYRSKTVHNFSQSSETYTPITLYHSQNGHSLDSSLSLFSQEYKKSQQLILHLKSELNKLKNSNQEQISHLNQQIDHIEIEEHHQLQVSISVLREQIREKDQLILDLTIELNRMKIDAESEGIKNQSIEHKEEKIRNLEERINNLSNKIIIAEESNNNKQNYISKLQSLINELTTRMENLQRNFDSELMEKEEQVQRLKCDLRNFEIVRNHELIHENKEFEEEIGSLKEIEKKIKMEVTQKKNYMQKIYH